jgi:diguanylate cyclase (GGDEF)-like protein
MLLDTEAQSPARFGAEPIGAREMSENTPTIDIDALGRIACESGVAVAVADGQGRELWAANDNSICRNLNPDGVFSPACSRYCGKALAKVWEVGRPIGFVCHAGLACRAIATEADDKPLVAIVGRTFLKSENYRKATERAIVGDWREFAPSEFFENVLLTDSADVLDGATRQVRQLVAEPKRGITNRPSDPRRADEFDRDRGLVPERLASPPMREPRAESKRLLAREVSAWRSFFGSILKNDYPRAVESLLRFIAEHYGLKNLIWLESKEGRLEHTAGLGEVNRQKARLGIKPDDPRLVQAFRDEVPLELGERKIANDDKRIMCLFPIGVDAHITAAIATVDQIRTTEDKKHIARICHSISQQLEILRLRHQAERHEESANAVRMFSESLKHIDTEDPWQSLTQKTAEILKAERASLLLFNDKAGSFDIKALIGSTVKFDDEVEVGRRVARVVFARKEPVLVGDVNRTGLPPAPAERHYRTSSFISCPINVGNRTIGVMSFTDRVGGGTFRRNSVELFQAIAPQLAMAIDHAALRERAGEFEQLSVTDPLTGLLNRRYIETRLLEEIRRSNRNGSPMSFLMIDVDHFKSYNDEFGHPAGDDALKMVGHVMRQTLRGADVAARFGGEEFSILLPQTTADEAAAIAERLRANIQNTNFPHRRVTVSVGIASCSADLCISADLISAADKALYEAKRKGRNRVQSFDDLNRAFSAR